MLLHMVVWLAAVAGGLAVVTRYELGAGASASHPTEWPAGLPLTLDSTKANLVVLAHPHCPCTRATLVELEQIMMRCEGRLKAHVLFYRPADESSAWAQTSLWKMAARIPGVEVIADPDGAVGKILGAETSGQALLFDAAGRRLFSGGITGARGHVGENRGLNLVVALVLGERPAALETPVFGCSLLSEATPLEVAR
jgi:hypothetical protein